MNEPAEICSLELLAELREALGAALNSLEGKQSNGLLDHFLGYSAATINRAADGYLTLRRASMIDASKLLIRPAMETMIRILAVRTQPDLLYRIAYTERIESRKLVRPIALKAGMDYDSEDEKAWKTFKQQYATHFPQHGLAEKQLSVLDAAKAAGIEDYYGRAYRLYSRFVHAAFTAAISRTIGRTSTDGLDNLTVADCVCCGLEAVVSIGGSAPSLDTLRMRLRSLTQSGPIMPGPTGR
jgi:hypothetical protein